MNTAPQESSVQSFRWNGKRMTAWADCANCGTVNIPEMALRYNRPGQFKCACGAIAKSRVVRDTHNSWGGKARAPCMDKCMAATGPNCDCFCEGRNHGAGSAL